MNDRTRKWRNNKKTNIAQSNNGWEAVESHDCPHTERSWHIGQQQQRSRFEINKKNLIFKIQFVDQLFLLSKNCYVGQHIKHMLVGKIDKTTFT